jgi:hypothetical protein
VQAAGKKMRAANISGMNFYKPRRMRKAKKSRRTRRR